MNLFGMRCQGRRAWRAKDILMGRIRAIELEERLQEALQHCVCTLVGPDESLRIWSLRKLKEALLSSDATGTTITSFEEPPPASEIISELRTAPFLGLPGRRVAIVEKGADFLKTYGDHILDYLTKLSPTGLLILSIKDGKAGEGADKSGFRDTSPESSRPGWLRSALKALEAAGAVIDCTPPSWKEAKQWARLEVEKRGNHITPRAIESLLEGVGPDLCALETEIEKLTVHVGPGATVTERDVIEMVPQARSLSAFSLAEAVVECDAARAVRLYRHLLLFGESRENILSVVALHLRRLWQIGRFVTARLTNTEIARRMNASPFVVEQAIKTLRSVPESRLAAQLLLLARAEADTKRASLRAQEEPVWTENLWTKLCQVGRLYKE